MPVLKDTDSLSDGLSGLGQVLQGALYADEQNFKRDVDERDYNLRVEAFDEGVRQFDDSFEENTRQFNENMAYNIEQNSLLKQHQVKMQDDRQAQANLIQDDQQTFLTTENKRDRAVEYNRTRESVRMQNEDRALRASKDRYADNRNYLGTSDSFATIPDEFLVDRNDNVHNPKDVQLRDHMQAIADGNGSSLFAGVDVPEAQEVLKKLKLGANKLDILKEYEEKGYFSRIPNTGKEEGLQIIMRKQSGLPQEEFDALSEKDYNNLRGSVVHQLNNTRQYEKMQNKLETEHAVAVRSADLGTGSYMGGANELGIGSRTVKTTEEMVREMNQDFNIPVTYSADYDFPTPSRDASERMQSEWVEGVEWTIKHRMIAEGIGTDEEKAAAMEQSILDLKAITERTRDTYIRDGYDGGWADKMHNAWIQKGTTNTYDRDAFNERDRTTASGRGGNGAAPNQDNPFLSPEKQAELNKAKARNAEIQGRAGQEKTRMTAERDRLKEMETLDVDNAMQQIDNVYLRKHDRVMDAGERERTEASLRKQIKYTGKQRYVPSGNQPLFTPKFFFNIAEAASLTADFNENDFNKVEEVEEEYNPRAGAGGGR